MKNSWLFWIIYQTWYSHIQSYISINTVIKRSEHFEKLELEKIYLAKSGHGHRESRKFSIYKILVRNSTGQTPPHQLNSKVNSVY